MCLAFLSRKKSARSPLLDTRWFSPTHVTKKALSAIGSFSFLKKWSKSQHGGIRFGYQSLMCRSFVSTYLVTGIRYLSRGQIIGTDILGVLDIDGWKGRFNLKSTHPNNASRWPLKPNSITWHHHRKYDQIRSYSVSKCWEIYSYRYSVYTV